VFQVLLLPGLVTPRPTGPTGGPGGKPPLASLEGFRSRTCTFMFFLFFRFSFFSAIFTLSDLGYLVDKLIKFADAALFTRAACEDWREPPPF
jgi:hypothetical protein